MILSDTDEITSKLCQCVITELSLSLFDDWRTDQLHQACDGAALRGSRVISAEDILFLMRRDKVNYTLFKQNKKRNNTNKTKPLNISIVLKKMPNYQLNGYILQNSSHLSSCLALFLSVWLNISPLEKSGEIIEIPPVQRL